MRNNTRICTKHFQRRIFLKVSCKSSTISTYNLHSIFIRIKYRSERQDTHIVNKYTEAIFTSDIFSDVHVCHEYRETWSDISKYCVSSNESVPSLPHRRMNAIRRALNISSILMQTRRHFM